MTNPLLEKFYELHPEKKEEIESNTSKVEDDEIISYDKNYASKQIEKLINDKLSDRTDRIEESYQIKAQDSWNDWMEAYRQVTTKKPTPIDPVLSSLTTNQSGVTVSQYNNTTTTAVSHDYQRHKTNYEFVEMAEKIKRNKANVASLTCDIDNYSRQKRYVFEVICDDAVYPF